MDVFTVIIINKRTCSHCDWTVRAGERYLARMGKCGGQYEINLYADVWCCINADWASVLH